MSNTKQPTLYRFHLDKATGVISRTEIPSYIIIAPYNENTKQYKFKINSTYQYAYHRKLDQFNNWNVYSFNNDINKVTDIIRQAIAEKCERLAKELDRYTTIKHGIDEVNKYQIN